MFTTFIAWLSSLGLAAQIALGASLLVICIGAINLVRMRRRLRVAAAALSVATRTAARTGAAMPPSEPIPVRVSLYVAVLFILYVLLPAVSYLGYAAWQWYDETMAWILVGFFYAHLIASIRVFSVSEIAGITLLEVPVLQTRFQIVIVPLGIMTLNLLPSGELQQDIPASPEMIFRSPDAEYSTEDRARGMSLPMRIVTGPGKGTDNLLDSQMAIEMEATVTIVIDRHRFFDFVVNIRSLNMVWVRLQDTLQGILTKEFASRSVSEVIRDLELIRNEVKDELERVTNGWGIDIVELVIKSPDTTHKVNQALRDVPVAAANAKAALHAADAQAYTIEKVGTARGVEIAAAIEGRGKGIAAAAAQLGLLPAQVLASETAIATLGKGSTVVLGASGLAEAVTAGTAIVNALKPSGTSPTPPSGGSGGTGP